MANIEFVEGFPENLHKMTSNNKNTLVIVDDIMSESSKDQRMSELFTSWGDLTITEFQLGDVYMWPVWTQTGLTLDRM